MTKTDELISKLEELLEVFIKDPINKSNSKMIELLPAISQLKEQIKKEENINDFTIPYLKSEYNQQLERITKIIGKKPDVFEQGINALLYIIENKINPDIMPDTCCGKYKEVIGFDVIERHNKKCFDDTLENIKKSMKDKGQLLKSTEEIPDLSKATEEQKRDSIQEVVELVSKTLLKVFIAFDLKNHIETMIINDATKKEYVLTFETADHFKERFSQPVNDITDTLPYPNPISKHQTDINIGWMRAMKYMKNQPVKDITDEEIEKWAQWTIDKYPGGDPDIKNYIKIAKITGAKWMRSKMK
jgi:hypothetical protein